MRVGNCSFQGDCEMTPKGSNISKPRLSGAKPGGSNPLQDNDLEEVEPTLLGNRALAKNKGFRFYVMKETMSVFFFMSQDSRSVVCHLNLFK